jgi:hypothetical protein
MSRIDQKTGEAAITLLTEDFGADFVDQIVKVVQYQIRESQGNNVSRESKAAELLSQDFGEEFVQLIRHKACRAVGAKSSAPDVEMLSADKVLEQDFGEDFLKLISQLVEYKAVSMYRNANAKIQQASFFDDDAAARSNRPSSTKKSVNAHVPSELHKSPFFLLGATTRDSKSKLIELADEKSLVLESDICSKARSDLITPRTRLAAEMAWFPGVSPKRTATLIESLQTHIDLVRGEISAPSLAHANLFAAVFGLLDPRTDTDLWCEWIVRFAYADEGISPDDVLREINEDRAISAFPLVKEVEHIEDELHERRRHYTDTIKLALDGLESMKLVEVVTAVVEQSTMSGEDHAPLLIHELVDRYEAEANRYLLPEAENINHLIGQIRQAAVTGEASTRPLVEKLDQIIRKWDAIAQPIQLSMKAQGRDHDLSHEVAWSVRSLAVDLFNKHDILTQSQRLTELLQELFSEIPEISERVEQDADALKGIVSDRNNIAEKFKDFNLSGNSFSWKDRKYDVSRISHVGFYRSITTHKTNFVETGKTEKAKLTLTFDNGQTLNLSFDELGIFWNKNRTQQIQNLADFYGYLSHITFDQRVKFYEDQIKQNGYWLYDDCYFYPRKKVVFRGKDFEVSSSSFLRSYGYIELRKKDFGMLDKIKQEVSLTKIPQFSTITDTDVIFHLLEKHMDLRWNS